MKGDTKEVEASKEGQSEAGAVLTRLADFFAAADVTIPEGLNVRTVYVGASIQEMAVALAGMLKGKRLLFRRGHDLGTIHPVTGEWENMDSDRFASWLPLVAGIHPYAGTDDDGKPKSCSFKAEDMRRVLRSDEIRNSVDEIRVINQVRLPVFRKELDDRGWKKIEFLPYGFDRESGAFTVRGMDYNTAPDPHEATKFLVHLLKYFPMDERSRAVQMGAMVTVFCGGMFSGRSPMFLWNSNLPGSGKSVQAQLAVLPYGEAAKAGFHWRDANETRKELDSTALEMAPYILFDDVVLPKGMKLRSTDLNRWLTGKVWEARLMHSQNKMRVPLHAATLMTGTQVSLDEHLDRRTLSINLEAKQRARDRVLPADAIILDDDFFDDPTLVRKVLEALAGLVLWWDECGRPGCPGRTLESFKSWSKVVPAIVGVSFGNCLAKPEGNTGGDGDIQEFEALVKAIIRGYGKGKAEAWVSMTDIIRTARLEGLFPGILLELDQIVRELDNKRGFGWEPERRMKIDAPDRLKRLPLDEWDGADVDLYGYLADPTPEEKEIQAAGWTDRSIETRWGNHFATYAVLGQWFQDDDGQFWTLEKRKRNRGTGYHLRQVKAEERG